jgi:hypothetical protein
MWEISAISSFGKLSLIATKGRLNRNKILEKNRNVIYFRFCELIGSK